MSFFSSRTFWLPFIITSALVSILFSWELNLINGLPALPRSPATTTEIIFSIALGFLLALNTGLLMWKRKNGTCPIGMKRATGTAGTIGAVALLCPVCLLLPFSLFGLSLSLAFLGPFLPLLRIIALVLLLVISWILLRK